MNRTAVLTLIVACLGVSESRTQQAPQVFTGRISDSICGASHQPNAGTSSDRQCMFQCFKALAKWVLVERNDNVLTIANQDLPGLPLYAGRQVQLTGQREGGVIVASRIEAYPPHLHLGHVMTNWRDTPGGVGFLIAAMSDARVALVHAKLVGRNPDNLDDMRLHAGHVLHALDPAADPGSTEKGPGSGYGVKRAAAGARQHLDLAAKGEGASDNVKTHATHVTALLSDALRWAEEAIAIAQKIRAGTSAASVPPLVNDLNVLTEKIIDGALAQAHAHMTLMMKGEGIENAPR
jgi:hypothetical protein